MKKKLITRVCFETEMSAREVDNIIEEWIMKGTLDPKELKAIVNSKATKIVGTVSLDWGMV